jgi:hypothetical protein
VLLVSGAALLIAANFYWSRRIRRWAEEKHLTLVDWRHAWFFEGPDRLTRNQYRHVFWIEIEDRDGICATGWLTFRSRFFGFDAEVEWN